MSSKHGWVQLPIEPAPPWLRLSAFARCLGADLFRVWQERVVCGIGIDTVEHVIVRMLAPNPTERKALRFAIRNIIAAGLIVPTEGGVRLLYGANTYASHASTVPPSSRQGGDKVAQGDGIMDARSTHGAVTPQAKPADTLDRNAHIDREKEKEDRENTGTRTKPLWEVTERPLTVRVWDRFAARFLVACSVAPSRTEKADGHAKTIATWLQDNRPEESRLADLDAMLETFFGDAWAIKHKYPIGALAGACEKYFAPPRRTSGFMPPAPPEAFTGPKESGDDIFGPLIDPSKRKPRGRA